jgi:hypothetical protein
MARISITLEDDGAGGVQVTTDNDTPTPDPSAWTMAHRAFYVASSAIGVVPAQDLIVDGRRLEDGES